MKKSHFLTAALAVSASLGATFPQPQEGGTATAPNKEIIQQYVADSQKVVDAWLALSDAEKYGESWDTASKTFQLTISKHEWETAMNTIRKPLGKVTSRKIIDIGSAENPKGLPAGEYMVFYYETAFANKPKGSELITLVLTDDGKWKILTYQVL